MKGIRGHKPRKEQMPEDKKKFEDDQAKKPDLEEEDPHSLYCSYD